MSVNVVNKSTGALTKVAGNAITEASGINYSHTTSGLAATNVQDAIDESYDSLKSGLTNLDNEVNGDATVYPYADVITIPDTIPANLADCNVKIEPVQDLHGQSAPYVGGAGKQKLPLDLALLKTLNTSGTWVDNVYTLNNVAFTVNLDGGGNVVSIKANGTASAKTIFYLGIFADFLTVDTSYIINSNIYPESDQGAVLQILKANDAGYVSLTEPYSFTYASEGNAQKLVIRVDNAATANNNVFTPMLRLSTETDATFSPYTNICPITGHTEASVQRDGKNLFDKDDAGIAVNKYLNYQTGELVNSTSNWDTSAYIPVKKFIGEDIVFSGMNLDASNVDVCYYDSSKNYISGTSSNVMTYTIPSDTRIAYLRFDYKHADADDIQLELGSSATDYEPYAGKTYTIALGSTIYGGTVDFDSGVMTVDRKIDTVGNLSFTKYDVAQGTLFRASISGIKTIQSYDTTTALCSAYASASSNDRADGTISQAGNATSIDIIDNRYSDAGDFKTAMGSTQICYELATPFTVQLTPTQIQLLKGQNTLTASTGQISVTVNGVSGAIGSVQEQVNGLTRAIGWDDARNIFNGIIRQGYVSNTTGEYVDSATRWVCTTKQECKENTTYTISASSIFLTRKIIVIYLDSNDTIISYSEFDHEASPVNINATITTPDNTAYIIVDIANQRNADGYNITPSDVWDVQIEEGTQVTPYIPYHPVIGTAVNKLLTKVPDAPSTDGTYSLQVTVASGVPTYSWVSTT